MLNLVGHKELRGRLLGLIAKERFPSCILLSGPPGIGKNLVAKEAAFALICECFQNAEKQQGIDTLITQALSGEDLFGPSLKLLLAGNHPDFIEIHAEVKEESDSEGIRSLLSRLSLKSFQSKKRVVVLSEAEKLGSASANALLKTLEEPRPDNFFILTSSNPSAVLSTIRSRCQHFGLNSLSEAEVAQVLRKAKPELEEEQIDKLAQMSEGSLEQIEALLIFVEETSPHR